MLKHFSHIAVFLICFALSAKAGSKAPVKQLTLPLPYYMKRTIETSPLKSELTSRIHKRQWKEAIALAEKFVNENFNEVQILDGSQPIEQKISINEWSWQATIGELYLFDLQPKIAIARFDSVRRYAPKPKKDENLFSPSPEESENYNARLRAANGLARAYAEIGQWSQALNWHEQALKEELRTQWCGNCMESVRMWAYPIRQVWKVAGKGKETSIKEIQKISDEKFQPMKVHLNHQRSVNKFQKRRAAQEAYLLLGEIYLRQGNYKSARLMFEKVCNGRDELDRTYLAATYLDRMMLSNPQTQGAFSSI